MKYHIRFFNAHQLATVVAVLLSFNALFSLPGIIMSFRCQPKEMTFSLVPFLFMVLPLFYPVWGYFFTRIFCWIFVKIGGIEIEINGIQNKEVEK